MSDRDAFRADIVALLHAGEVALLQGDVRPRLEMWSHVDPVTIFGAVGASRSGWDQLEPMFQLVASRLSGGRDVTFELIAFDVCDEIAWTAGIVRFTVSMDGAPANRYTLRATHAFRRESGEWKVVHEHTDFQPADHPAPPSLPA